MNEQFWWFLARSSGVVAWVLLTMSVLWGILLATDLFASRRRPAWLLDLHRWLGGLTTSFVLVHMGALVADSYVHFSIPDLLVPLRSAWKPIPVALGVVAMWGVVAVQATSLAMKKLPKRIWRAIHLTSYSTFWLASLHGTFSGTDASRPLYVGTSVLTLGVTIFAVTYRILNGRRRRRPQRPERAPVEATETPAIVGACSPRSSGDRASVS